MLKFVRSRLLISPLLWSFRYHCACPNTSWNHLFPRLLVCWYAPGRSCSRKDYDFLQLFNVSDDGENTPWWWDEGLVDDHSSQIGLIKNDMGWLNMIDSSQVGRTYCPLAAAYGRATQQFGGCTAHQGGASGWSEFMDWHAAHVVYSVDKYLSFLLPYPRIAKAGTSTGRFDNICDFALCDFLCFKMPLWGGQGLATDSGWILGAKSHQQGDLTGESSDFYGI